MKYLFIGVILVGILTILGFLFKTSTQTPLTMQPITPQPTSPPTITTAPRDSFASFAIYTNGIFRVFTAAMYHNRSSEIFITSQNPNVITIKKPDATWNDFFSTLPFSLSNTCLTTGTKETFCTGKNGTLSFYLNGISQPNALEREIQNGDKLLVTFGNPNAQELQKQLQSIPQAPSN